MQATAADGAEEENEEFDAIEKLDQLGVNRGEAPYSDLTKAIKHRR